MTNQGPRRRNDLAVEILLEEARMTDPDSGETHVLNPSAYAIWEMCDGETSIETMAEAVAEITAMSLDEAEDQVRRSVDLLMERGLVG